MMEPGRMAMEMGKMQGKCGMMSGMAHHGMEEPMRCPCEENKEKQPAEHMHQ